jgi:exodeoxyribonuclease-3
MPRLVSTKLASWNVNGIRACVASGHFLPWLEKNDFDVVGLQEVRALPEQIPLELQECKRLPFRHWFSAQKKGYSGVGILSRVQPKQVLQGIGVDEFDAEGRVLAAEFENFVFVTAYFPNSQDQGARLPYKLRFCEALLDWMNRLEKKLGKTIVLNGDFNIAHQAIDLARPKENEKTAGYLPEERAWMSSFVTAGWVDSFRHIHPTKTDAYSWWSARTNARPRNIGWRIDYFAVSPSGKDQVADAGIQSKVMGSDHCPVWVELGPL